MADAGHDTDHPRPGTRHPHRARARALKVLFQADLRGQDPHAALERVAEDRAALALLDDLDPQDASDEPSVPPADVEPLDDYTRTLVDGVAEHAHALDETIEKFAHRWSVPRMPAVDRNILRLATYELLHEDTPAAIVIDEALELAKDLSTERSSPYINGVLESIRKSLEARRA